MWIFGYGSLIWKVDFPYEQKVVGYIKGYIRRFWQASIDHRGVPERPGRVVTLVPSENPEEALWGVAYKVSEEDVEKVILHLDHREKGGYKRTPVVFYPKDSKNNPFELTIYLGNEDNPFYSGPTSETEIAKIIHKSVGPSGSNKEYLFELEKALQNIDIQDPHIINLSTLVKSFE